MKLKLLSACLALFVSHAPALGADVIWITNVKLVSPDKLDRIEPGSVLIEHGRIAAVTRGPSQTRPAGARKVDGRGYYLTPGLIDSHVHLHAVPGMSLEQAREETPMTRDYYAQLPRSFLYYGYTTVVDLALADRALIERFRRAPLHPDVVHCGEPLVFANGYPMSYLPASRRFKEFGNFIYDPQQAASIPPEYRPAEHTPTAGVARIKAAGAACVKTHFERGFGAERNLPVMSPAVFAEVRAAATGHRLALVTHANSYEGQVFAVDGDADVIAHGLWQWGSLNQQAELPAEIKALLDRVVEKRIGYQATMRVLHSLGAYADPRFLRDSAVRKVVPAALAAWFDTPEGKWFGEEVAEGATDAQVLQGLETGLRRLRQVVAYLAARNANFLLATDTPSSPSYGNLPGLNGYLEMQHLHHAGLSLRQVFEAATINNARAFGLDADVGSIETGKAANLLLMKTSPLEDIAAYDSIVTVWVGGKQVERARLAADDPRRK